MDQELREKLRRWRPKLNEFANRVRQARLDAKIEQTTLAKAVQRPRLWLTKRENGHVRMNIPDSQMLLAAIARMKRSQKVSHENTAKEVTSQKPDNRAIA